MLCACCKISSMEKRPTATTLVENNTILIGQYHELELRECECKCVHCDAWITHQLAVLYCRFYWFVDLVSHLKFHRSQSMSNLIVTIHSIECGWFGWTAQRHSNDLNRFIDIWESEISYSSLYRLLFLWSTAVWCICVRALFNWNYFPLLLHHHHFHFFSQAASEQLNLIVYIAVGVCCKQRSIDSKSCTYSHTQSSMKTIKITPHQITIFFPLINAFINIPTSMSSAVSCDYEINASQFLRNEIFDERHHKRIRFVNISRGISKNTDQHERAREGNTVFSSSFFFIFSLLFSFVTFFENGKGGELMS